MKVKMITFLISLFVCSESIAFINVESLRKKTKEGLNGRASVKHSRVKGNTDTSTTEASNVIVNSKNLDERISLVKYKYGESFSQRNANQGSVHFRYTRKSYERLFFELYGQGEFNEFKAINRRLLLGSGLRSPILNSPSSSLYGGIGFFYEDEIIDDPTLEDDLTTPTVQENIVKDYQVRGNIYLSGYLKINENAHIDATLYYQPSTEDGSDQRTQLDLQAQFPISSVFSFLVEYHISSDANPPNGIEKVDTSFLTGVTASY